MAEFDLQNENKELIEKNSSLTKQLNDIKYTINLLFDYIDVGISLNFNYSELNKKIESIADPVIIDLNQRTTEYIEQCAINENNIRETISTITDLYEENDLDVNNENTISLYLEDNIKTRIISEKKPNTLDCDFPGHCEWCSDTDANDPVTARETCKKCHRCSVLRDQEKKTVTKNAIRYYDECIVKKDHYYPMLPEPIVKPKIKSNQTNITNIMNINTININHLTVNVKEYIQTKDSIFNVIISSSHEKADEKLRYIFTYLMCGANGKKLFPNELKHSKAITYPVVAARYNIMSENDKYTLNGVLRYQHQKKNSMTIKKLENMGDRYVSVKATNPSLWENSKYHLSINDVDDMMLNTIDNFKGSHLQDFYLED